VNAYANYALQYLRASLNSEILLIKAMKRKGGDIQTKPEMDKVI
jgi:hypothetical protein